MQIKVRTTLRGLCMKDGNQFSDKQIPESMLLGFLDYRLSLLGLKVKERTRAFETHFRSKRYNHKLVEKNMHRNEKRNEKTSGKYTNNIQVVTTSCVVTEVMFKKSCHGGY